MKNPLDPPEATRVINEFAKDRALQLIWTLHAKERLRDRNLIMADVLHLLKSGFVHEAAEPATRGLYKYKVDGVTPNSNGRYVRVIVIPADGPTLKLVTVMWRDK